jgi:uncharacterized Zn-finger protein
MAKDNKNNPESEVTYVEDSYIQCDGNGQAVGHPMIYLDMGGKKEMDCPYCGQHFKLK